MGTAAEPFEINTKGICLLCLADCNSKNGNKSSSSSLSSSSNNNNTTNNTYNVGGTSEVESFKSLLRHLQVDLLKLPNFASSLQEECCSGEEEEVDVLENTDLVVHLCGDCGSLAANVREWLGKLEHIRTELGKCVSHLYGLMKEGEGDPARVREFRWRMRTRNPYEMVNVSIAEHLRKEALHKCSMSIEGKLAPPSSSKRVGEEEEEEEEGENGIKIAATFPVLPPRASPACDPLNQSSSSGSQRGGTDTAAQRRSYAQIAGGGGSGRVDHQQQLQQHQADELMVKLDPSLFQQDEEDDDDVNGDIEFVYEGDDVGPMAWDGDDDTIDNSPAIPSPALEPPPPPPPPGSSSKSKKTCEVCGRVFESPSKLAKHMIIHSGEKPFVCSYCGKATADYSNHVTHLMTIHTLEHFSAQLPPDTTRSALARALLDEQKDYRHVSKGSRKYVGCRYCKKVHPRDIYLRHHIIRSHFEKVVERLNHNLQEGEPSSSSTRSLPPFKSNTAFALVSKRGRKPIPKGGKNKVGGGGRRRKPYKCNVCGKGCMSTATLNIHKRVHNGATAISCNYCGKASSTKSTHNQHILTVHPMEEFGSEFPPGTTPELLKQATEEFIPHPEFKLKYYGCLHCANGYSKPSKLKEHVLRNHFPNVITRLQYLVAGAASNCSSS